MTDAQQTILQQMRSTYNVGNKNVKPTSPIYRPNAEYIRKRRRVQIDLDEFNAEIDQENADPDPDYCKYQWKIRKNWKLGLI